MTKEKRQLDLSKDLNQLSQSAKIRIHQALSQQIQYKSHNKIHEYGPENNKHPVQPLFHGSSAHIRLFSAGNRCLPLDTQILKATGDFCPLDEINIGDYVICEGSPSPVIAVHRAGLKRCYKVVFEDGGSITASEDHVFPIAFGSGRKFIKRPLRDVIRRKMVSVSKKARMLSYKNICFKNGNKRKLRIHPYLLGALIGDGCLSTYHSFSNPDKEVLKRVSFHLKSLGYELRKQKEGGCDWRISSIVKIKRTHLGQFGKSELGQELKRLGLRCRAYKKHIPHQYKTASVDDRIELLSGLIDTDGSVDEYSTVSKQLAYDFQFLVKSLGGKATITEHVSIYEPKTNLERSNCYYRVYWRLNAKLPLALKRKQIFSKRIPAYNHRIIKKIICVGEKECGDITVAHPSHNYVAGDWVVVGNSGKSTGGAVESYYFSKGEFPYNPHFQNTITVPNKGRIIAEDFPNYIRGIILPKIYEWFDPSFIKKQIKNQQGIVSQIICANGSTIELYSYDQAREKFGGADLDWVWFDEVPPQEVYKETLMRLLDRDGYMWLTLTPLREPWIYDDLFAPGLDPNVKDIETFVMATHDNPYLSKEGYNRIISRLSEEDKLTRIQGIPSHLLGTIYKDYRDKPAPEGNLISIDPPSEWPVYEGIDPSLFGKPQAVVWLALSPDNYFVVVDEIYEQLTLPDLAVKILKTRALRGLHVVSTIIDPAIKVHEAISNQNYQFVLRQAGIHTKLAARKDNLEPGIEYIKSLLIRNDRQLTPRLFIHERCKRLRFEFTHWVRGQDQEPIKKYKDCLDALRYIFVTTPGFTINAQPIKTHVPETYGNRHGANTRASYGRR